MFTSCLYLTSILLFYIHNVSKGLSFTKSGWQKRGFWEMCTKKTNLEKYALLYLLLRRYQTVIDAITGLLLNYLFKNQHLLYFHVPRESKKRWGVCGGGKGGDNPKNDPGHHCPPSLHTLGRLFLAAARFYAVGQITIRTGGMVGLTGAVGVRGKHAIKRGVRVRAGGKKRRRVWTAACRAQVLTTKVCLDAQWRWTYKTYLFSKTIVSESSWTSLM